MNNVVKPGAWLGKFMAGLAQKEQTRVINFEYSTLAARLQDLRSAVEAAIAADKQEAASHWTDLSRVLNHGFNYAAENRRFQGQADALVADVRGALADVESLCRGQLQIHAGVPAKLKDDSERWEGYATAVGSKIDTCRRLQHGMSNWSGTARVGHDTTIEVQVAALTELAGVMRSTATGCTTGATLNQAIFYAVDKAVKRSTNNIRGSRGGGGAYYVRCSRAHPELSQLRSQIQSAIEGEVTAGSEMELSSELRRTVSMPNLLTPGRWPRGVSAAGVAPAGTDRGVTSDGYDADLNVERGPGFCRPGVDL